MHCTMPFPCGSEGGNAVPQKQFQVRMEVFLPPAESLNTATVSLSGTSGHAHQLQTPKASMARSHKCGSGTAVETQQMLQAGGKG